MNKVLACLVFALLGTVSAAPAFAQDVAALASAPVIIAPPQTPLARTIKEGLSLAYYGAAKGSTIQVEAPILR